jgi:hypothetical protein
MTTWPYRKQWWGFTNVGPIQIPPNPQYLILTDRTTGTQYWVFWNAATQQVGINTALPANPIADGPTTGPNDPGPVAYNNPAYYDAWDEPVLGFFDDTNFARLIIDTAYLGISIEQLNRQFGSTPNAPKLNIIPRILGFNGTFATIILGGTAALPSIGYDVNTLTQTPNPAPYIPSTSQQYDD